MRSEDIYKQIFKTWYEPLKHIIYTNKFEKFLILLEDKYKKKDKKLLPGPKNVFKPFSACEWGNMHTVILFDRKSFNFTSNGLVFGQDDCCIGLDYEVDLFYKCLEKSNLRKFTLKIDESLESYASQGFLLLNTTYTDERYNRMQHVKFWYRFNIELLKVLSLYKSKINYVLIGQEAWKYSKHITGKNSYIFKVESFRNAEEQFRDWNFDFTLIDKLIKCNHNKNIIW